MRYNCAVLLATYNGEKYIMEQIKSILLQKDIDITIFVSDDGSDDSTLSLIKSIKNNKIVILPKTGRMGSAAQNFFRLINDVDLSKYNFIAFSDQDDIWNQDKIIKAINIIKNKNIDAYSSDVIAFWEDGKTKLVKKSYKEKKWDYLFSSAGAGCTLVLKSPIASKFKDEINKKKEIVANFDLNHDWLIYAYCRSNNFKWYVDPEPSMMYRQHSDNELGANSGYKSFLSRWHKGRGGWYGEQIINIAKFCDKMEEEPIKLLLSKSIIKRLRLLKIVFELRRSKLDAIFLLIMIVIPDFKYKNNTRRIK